MIFNRVIAMAKDLLQVLAHHDTLERQEIKAGLGIYPKDQDNHIHKPRIRHGDDNAR
jgi:hypothetical protein